MTIGAKADMREGGHVASAVAREFVCASLLIYVLCVVPVSTLAASSGWLPAFPLWMGAAILLAAYAAVLVADSAVVGPPGWSWRQILAFTLFGWVVAIILVSGPELWSETPAVYRTNVVYLVFYGGAFLVIGAEIDTVLRALERPAWRRVLQVATFGVIAGIVRSVLAHPAASLLPWYLLSVPASATDGTPLNYIIVSDSLALLVLFHYARQRAAVGRALVLLLGIILSVLTLSRSALVVLLASAFLLALVRWRTASWKMRALCLGAAGVATTAIGLLFLGDVMGDSRFNLLRLSADASLIERQDLLARGWHDLEGEWLLGRYLGEALDGRPGEYVHNWLSFWIAFGVGPFILSAGLMVSAWGAAAIGAWRNPKSGRAQLVLGWGTFIALSVLMSRSYGFYCAWFLCAVTASTRRAMPYAVPGSATAHA